MKKKALITGITGQDGSYLSEFLLDKNYEVHGLIRRLSDGSFGQIKRCIDQIVVHDGNLRDDEVITRVIKEVDPDEIYNLAAQSAVGISFDCPEETIDVNYNGLGRLVDAAIKFNPDVRIYQASTSEMFGNTPPPQNENSPFNPMSPYAESKLRAYKDYVRGYRNRYGIFISSGILFNHESPRRGEYFVTRKISKALARISLGIQDVLELGNLEAKRDWGFAGDYVEAMWLMLQQSIPDDYVVATGEAHSVKEFVETAAEVLGINIQWEGAGVQETGRNENGKVIVRVNEKFYRPKDVNYLCGDNSKAKERLGWVPKMSFYELVKKMVLFDLDNEKKMI